MVCAFALSSLDAFFSTPCSYYPLLHGCPQEEPEGGCLTNGPWAPNREGRRCQSYESWDTTPPSLSPSPPSLSLSSLHSLFRCGTVLCTYHPISAYMRLPRQSLIAPLIRENEVTNPLQVCVRVWFFTLRDTHRVTAKALRYRLEVITCQSRFCHTGDKILMGHTLLWRRRVNVHP